MTLLSVVIPTKNRLPLLQEAVDSIRRLPGSWEALIVDDASTDETWSWLSSIQDERFRPIRNESNLERSASRNKGLEMARGRYVIFLDDDDRLRPPGVGALTAILDERSSAVAAVGGQTAFDGSGHTRQVPQTNMATEAEIWRDVLCGWSRPPGQWVLRADAIRAVGGWDENLIAGEDGELWLRLGRSGPVILHPEVILEKRVHDDRWRPQDLSRVVLDYRLDFIAQLPPPERDTATRYLAARELRRRATAAWSEDRAQETLHSLLAALLLTPRLISSPATRGEILAQIAKASVALASGRRGSTRLRELSRKARTVLGNDPGGGRSIPTVEGSAYRDSRVKP